MIEFLGEAFSLFCEMTMRASWVILAVLLCRFLLVHLIRAPRRFAYAL